jgi:hypothetical protein
MPGCPSHVAWLITTAGVDPIKAVPGRGSLTNVTKEGEEVIIPLMTDLNTQIFIMSSEVGVVRAAA